MTGIEGALTTGTYLGQYPIYEAARAQHGNVFYGSDGELHVLGYREVIDVFRRQNHFGAKVVKVPKPFERAMAMLFESIVLLDGEEHADVRRALSPPLHHKNVGDLVTTVRRVVDDTLDKASQKPKCDLAKDVALPITTEVIAGLLGIPEHDRPLFQRLSLAFEPVLTLGPAEVSKPLLVKAALSAVQLNLETRKLLKDSKGHSTDLKTALRSAPGSIQAHIGNFLVFYNGGYETTRSGIVNGFAALFSHPDQLALLKKMTRENANLVPAVDELLRFDSPGQRKERVALQDTDVAGVRVRAGTAVHCHLGAANRDETVWKKADELILDRANPARNLAFGWGPHNCPGAGLAREEIAAVLADVDRISPDYPDVSQLTTPRSRTFSSVNELPVKIAPSRVLGIA